LNLFHAQELVLVTENAHGAGGLPSWLARFVREAAQETATRQVVLCPTQRIVSG